jgi:actin-binding LIM protein
MGKSKIACAKCQKKCSGEVLRVTEKYFHKSCFQCKNCNKSLATGGFFTKDGAYYCITDYQKLYGTKCAACNEYVEGEVVQTMGKTYHQKCFTCTRCHQPFQSGAKVTNTGKEVVCETCITASPTIIKKVAGVTSSPKVAMTHQQEQETARKPQIPKSTDPNDCAGCSEALKEGQALIALDRQWHIWCFK